VYMKERDVLQKEGIMENENKSNLRKLKKIRMIINIGWRREKQPPTHYSLPHQPYLGSIWLILLLQGLMGIDGDFDLCRI
jgi:hypothetical protein